MTIINCDCPLNIEQGAPDHLWFLAQDYLSHVHNLSANLQLNWKIPEQVSRGGGHQTYPIS
jgi:hypothetical protein